MVYKWYSPCHLGDYMVPTTYEGNQETPLMSVVNQPPGNPKMIDPFGSQTGIESLETSLPPAGWLPAMNLETSLDLGVSENSGTCTPQIIHF